MNDTQTKFKEFWEKFESRKQECEIYLNDRNKFLLKEQALSNELLTIRMHLKLVERRGDILIPALKNDLLNWLLCSDEKPIEQIEDEEVKADV